MATTAPLPRNALRVSLIALAGVAIAIVGWSLLRDRGAGPGEHASEARNDAGHGVSIDGRDVLFSEGSGYPTIVDRPHDGAVRAVAQAGAGKVFATAGEDGVVRVWEPTFGRTHRMLAELPAAATPVDALALSPDGATVFVLGGGGSRVEAWAVEDGGLLSGTDLGGGAPAAFQVRVPYGAGQSGTASRAEADLEVVPGDPYQSSYKGRLEVSGEDEPTCAHSRDPGCVVRDRSSLAYPRYCGRTQAGGTWPAWGRTTHPDGYIWTCVDGDAVHFWRLCPRAACRDERGEDGGLLLR